MMKLSVTANSEYKKMYYYCYYAFHFFSRLRAEPHMGLMRDKIPNYRLWSNCLKGCYYYDSTKGTFISISNTNIKIRADFTNCAHICFDNQLNFSKLYSQIVLMISWSWSYKMRPFWWFSNKVLIGVLWKRVEDCLKPALFPSHQKMTVL